MGPVGTGFSTSRGEIDSSPTRRIEPVEIGLLKLISFDVCPGICPAVAS